MRDASNEEMMAVSRNVRGIPSPRANTVPLSCWDTGAKINTLPCIQVVGKWNMTMIDELEDAQICDTGNCKTSKRLYEVGTNFTCIIIIL